MHKYQTSVLLVEADRDARVRHETALRAAGFSVLALPTWSADRAVQAAAVIVTDVPSFLVLQHAPLVERLPAVVVIAGTTKAGVSACLHGAEDWTPVDGDNAYLVKTVEHALHHS